MRVSRARVQQCRRAASRAPRLVGVIVRFPYCATLRCVLRNSQLRIEHECSQLCEVLHVPRPTVSTAAVPATPRSPTIPSATTV
eukprot:241699-Chlamydomonas_euryale.AAC.3